MSSLLFVNAAQVVTCAGPGRGRRGREMADADVRTGVAVAIEGATIAVVGAEDDLKRSYPDAETVDCGGLVLTPGLVDSHTHAIFGRARYKEQELRAFKKQNRGVITNSDYYLEQIPRYVRGEVTEPCRSGIRTIHIDPTGHVKRCPDFATDFHWKDFKKYEPIACNACFYACRGEAQAPITINRVRDVMATAR